MSSHSVHVSTQTRLSFLFLGIAFGKRFTAKSEPTEFLLTSPANPNSKIELGFSLHLPNDLHQEMEDLLMEVSTPSSETYGILPIISGHYLSVDQVTEMLKRPERLHHSNLPVPSQNWKIGCSLMRLMDPLFVSIMERC